jgi:Flp pilus assembly protein TadG
LLIPPIEALAGSYFLGFQGGGNRLQGDRMKILKDESGQAALLMATFLALLALGFMALAVDVGYFFREKRMAQGAADAAAIAAAEESSAGDTTNMQTAANAVSKMNGFDPGSATHPATVQINNPPLYGGYAGSSGYVEVIVSKPVSSFFLGAFSPSKALMTVSGRSVAGGGQTSPTCICLEQATGMGLNMSNDAQLNASSCGITVDSGSSNAVGVVGSAGINALSLGTVSTNWDNSSNVNNAGTISSSTKVVTGVAACSPTIAAPTLPSGITCYANPVNGWTAANNYTGVYALPIAGETAVNNTICYTSMNTSNAASVTFTPGYTYYIQGGFTTGGGAPVNGSNVSFYVAGTVNIANGVTVNLTAPASNGVPGTLFYVAGNTVTMQGGSNSNLSGLIYAPNAAITLDNGTGTTTDMDIVAQSLTMAGGAALNSYADTNLGTLNSSVAKVVE